MAVRPRSGSNKKGSGLATGGKRKYKTSTSGGIAAPKVPKVTNKKITLGRSSNWLGKK